MGIVYVASLLSLYCLKILNIDIGITCVCICIEIHLSILSTGHGISRSGKKHIEEKPRSLRLGLYKYRYCILTLAKTMVLCL